MAKINNMEEARENWKQYKKEKEKQVAKQEMDKFLNKIIDKNGVTKI